MDEAPLFGPFSRKGSYSRVQVLDNLFADDRFTALYQETSSLPEIDELMLYRRYLKKKDRVLVHGNFSAKLFNTLCAEGYDLYLVEPELNRIAGISEQYLKRVYGLSNELIDVMGNSAFNKIILPGTTIARYSRGELLLFFRNIRHLLATDGQLLVNIYNSDYLRRHVQPIASRRIHNCTLFYGQKVDRNRLIFNSYLKSETDEKVAYLIEHLYEPDTLFEFAKLSRYRGRTLYAGKSISILELDKLG
ncbi:MULTISPECIES: hypothetical protein [Exiguobacterium]|uniref:hypothetical protein n=1 Tax=Exiguobacterium TaxID=33986 RepID=UPI00047DD51C|nr:MULTISPECIES: hypothetical protein [Exiguobacterium]MCK2156210.1 hypothetical protein [Exiguobacterium sp. 17-1]